MKIILMHNPTAGNESYNAKKLVSMLEKAGHYVIYQSVKEKDYPKILGRAAELILVAGGDGTVKKVALAAVDTIGAKTPIAILMLGTANNLAKSLNVAMPPEDMIASLAEMPTHPFDVGLLKSPYGNFHFIEGCGSGLFAEFLHLIINREKKGKPSDIFKLLRETASEHKTAHYEAHLDGVEISGDYLLLQTMNIKSVGANLTFAPTANLGDGHLELVTATEENRSGILQSLQNEEDVCFSLPIRRFRHLKIRLPEPLIHLDDKVKKEKFSADEWFEVEVLPGALTFLAPVS